MMIKEEKLLREFENLNLSVREVAGNMCLNQLHISNNFKLEIQKAQQNDQKLQKMLQGIEQRKQREVTRDRKGVSGYKGRICVPNMGDLRRCVNRGSQEWILNSFWGYQYVKIEHQKPFGILQPLEIPKWNWEVIIMDFVSGLSRTREGFDVIWYEAEESSLLGPELVTETTEQIKKNRSRILTAQSHQKSYADQRRKPLEFEEGDHVFLRVTPTTGIGRVIKTKKLNPRYIGPFQVLKRIGPMAY
ncbi:uncharacterized protein [Arachis hypogaea]|uniref:uncharacterized protein n=1 Tax=Arachis hypogaea TaxID=3818 RepID=UPI003B20C6F7